MLIDTHCHLDFNQFNDDRDEVIKRAKLNKIEYIINVGSSAISSINSKELADKYDNIFFTIGFHPHYAEEFNEKDLEKIKNLTKSNKLVAIGEIGLDYYKSFSDKDKQKDVFIEFIRLSRSLDLPLIIHSRESHSDTYSILKDESKNFSKIVFHCFSGSDDFLDKCLDLEAMFSFTANITYPKANRLKEQVKRIPLQRIMLETDSPYLAPQKYRGQRNEPSYIHFIAEELASLKGMNFKDIAEITTQNAKMFFKLDMSKNEYISEK